jgi:hypothetical protein
MEKSFRPTIQQMEYFNVDLVNKLIENEIIRESEDGMVNSIDWYDWDNDPRWFVHVSLYNERGERQGYVEVDVWVNSGNGGDNPIGIEKVEIAGHGYPCSSVTIVRWDKEIDDYIIREEN